MKSSGFGLRAELSFGMGWNEGDGCCGGKGGGGGGRERWLEGLGGQNREEGQGVCGMLGAQLPSTESRNTLNSQLSVYPAGQSKLNMPACYLFTVSVRGWPRGVGGDF